MMRDPSSHTKPRLILHAGAHKTGTTAIQAFAYRNRHALKQRGIWYPTSYPGFSWRAIDSHHLLSHAIAQWERGKRMSLETVQRILEQWRQRAHGSTMLLSTEAVWRHVLPPDSEDWSTGRCRYLERLAELLSAFDTRIVIILRRPDDYIESLYREHVMKGTELGRLTFTGFVDVKRATELRYLENINHFEAFFKSIQLLVYEDLTAGDGLYDNFCRSIGLDAQGLHRPGVVRKSMTAKQTLIKRVLNHGVSTGIENRRLIRWLKSKRVTDAINHHWPDEPRTVWPSHAARREFLAAFARDTEEIRGRFFPERAELFPPLADDANGAQAEQAVPVELLGALLAERMKLPGLNRAAKLFRAVWPHN